MSLLIYSPKSSPRLEYILEFLFGTIIGCQYKVTHELEEFTNAQGAKINYSKEQHNPNGLNIVPIGMMEEDDLNEYHHAFFNWDNLPVIYKTSTEEIPFDIFSASFFLLSRYEEYLDLKLDEFQRFPHTSSIAYKYNFLDRPIIDQWAQRFKKILQSNFPELQFEENEFQFIPTYDIDIAYSYKHKGLLRNAGGALRDLSRGDLSAIKNRMQVLTHSEKDPFDSFEFLDDLHKEHKLTPIYFFLLGSGGKLDKNLSVNNPQFKELIQQISKKYEVGIHPSYRSNDEQHELQTEINRLDTLTSSDITKSRQHYIRFTLPETYKKLIAHGIKEDYSMGYGSINGFRASTSHPFYWFDLDKNEKRDLKVFPFCFMECNSFFEQKQNIKETNKEIAHYIKEVKEVNGTFISVWHNFSLGTYKLWTGWGQLYQDQVSKLKELL